MRPDKRKAFVIFLLLVSFLGSILMTGCGEDKAEEIRDVIQAEKAKNTAENAETPIASAESSIPYTAGTSGGDEPSYEGGTAYSQQEAPAMEHNSSEQGRAAGRKSDNHKASNDAYRTSGIYATPESTIQQLENALNACDLNRVAECFDKHTRMVLSGGEKILSSAIDLDIASLIELTTGLAGMTEGAPGRITVDIVVTDVTYSSDGNCCMADIEAASSDAPNDIERGQMKLVLEDGEWKIKLTLQDFM